MLESDWHTSKKCITGQVIRLTCDRTTTDLRARDPRTQFVSLSAKTQAPESQPRPDRRDTLATDLRLTWDALRPISDRPTTWARPPRVTCLTRQKVCLRYKFQEWLATYLRSCRMTYEAIEWFTTNLRRLVTKGGSSCELGHSQVKLTSSTTVFDG